MTGYVREIIDLVDKYGLKISSMDATDVTLIARLELVPAIFVQVYRNTLKGKLNLALIVGNTRIHGFDSEGGMTHEHPIQGPESHVRCGKGPETEQFILECLTLLKDRDLI